MIIGNILNQLSEMKISEEVVNIHYVAIRSGRLMKWWVRPDVLLAYLTAPEYKGTLPEGRLETAAAALQAIL